MPRNLTPLTLEGEGQLRTPEVCELLRVARSTWLSWVQQKIAPSPVRLGRITTWRKSDIRAFIDAAARGSDQS